MAKNQYTLERPATKERVISLLAEGHSESAVAELVATKQRSVTQQAVNAFAVRHAAEIAERQQMIASLAKTDWIGNKEQRIRELASLYQVLSAELAEHGPRVKEVREIAEDGTQTTTRYGGGWLPVQLRGILRDAAEELGQIDRPGTTVNVDARSILVRQYDIDAEAIPPSLQPPPST